MIAVGLKTIQKIDFKGNLAQNSVANTTLSFIIEEVKETLLDFSQGTVKVLLIFFYFNVILV